MQQLQLSLIAPRATCGDDTLVLMPCSGSKLAHEAELIELYTGPLWQTLRTHLGSIPRSNVMVLSALLGFRCATYVRSEPYDRRLGEAQAAYLIAGGVMRRNDGFGSVVCGASSPHPWVESHCASRRQPYRFCINAGAGLYRNVLDVFAAEFRRLGGICPQTETLRVVGGIGQQRAQLAAHLRACQ